MLPDMDLTRLSPADRHRVAYYLEHHLINAISPLAYCLDSGSNTPRLIETARHAKSRVVALVNEVRELAGLRPAPERQLFPGAKPDTSLQLCLRL